MTATAELASHIRLDDRGVAWVDDTNTKVKEIVLDWLAHGWSPAEIHFQHPHLSLAQIHAAFTCYYDHQAGMDAQIEQEFQESETARLASLNSPLHQKLRARGLVA